MTAFIISLGVLLCLCMIAAAYLRKRPECRPEDEVTDAEIREWARRQGKELPEIDADEIARLVLAKIKKRDKNPKPESKHE